MLYNIEKPISLECVQPGETVCVAGPQSSDVKACVHSWEEKPTVIKKLVTLLNSYTPPEIRKITIGGYTNS